MVPILPSSPSFAHATHACPHLALFWALEHSESLSVPGTLRLCFLSLDQASPACLMPGLSSDARSSEPPTAHPTRVVPLSNSASRWFSLEPLSPSVFISFIWVVTTLSSARAVCRVHCCVLGPATYCVLVKCSLVLNRFPAPQSSWSSALLPIVVCSFQGPNCKVQVERYGLAALGQVSTPDSNSWVQVLESRDLHTASRLLSKVCGWGRFSTKRM